VDEVLKHATEHAGIAEVKAWLKVFDQLMQAEQIPDVTRRRVLSRFLFGDPDGDVFEKASLEVEAAVAAMDPETLLGFRKGEWITSAEEAGWGNCARQGGDPPARRWARDPEPEGRRSVDGRR